MGINTAAVAKPMMEDVDLFAQSKTKSTDNIDAAAWQWAQNLIEDVNKDLHGKKKEGERIAKFNQAWSSWTSLARFVGTMDLAFHRAEEVEENQLRFHEIITSSLVAFGIMIEDISQNLPAGSLELIGFREKGFKALLRSVRDSNQDWHVPVSSGRMTELRSVIFGGDDKK